MLPVEKKSLKSVGIFVFMMKSDWETLHKNVDYPVQYFVICYCLEKGVSIHYYNKVAVHERGLPDIWFGCSLAALSLGLPITIWIIIAWWSFPFPPSARSQLFSYQQNPHNWTLVNRARCSQCFIRTWYWATPSQCFIRTWYWAGLSHV